MYGVRTTYYVTQRKRKSNEIQVTRAIVKKFSFDLRQRIYIGYTLIKHFLDFDSKDPVYQIIRPLLTIPSFFFHKKKCEESIVYISRVVLLFLYDTYLKRNWKWNVIRREERKKEKVEGI